MKRSAWTIPVVLAVLLLTGGLAFAVRAYDCTGAVVSAGIDSILPALILILLLILSLSSWKP